MTKTKRCCLCGLTFTGWGNNPAARLLGLVKAKVKIDEAPKPQ